MLPFLSLLGIFLSAILLYFNAKKYRSSLYLGLFFLFTSLYGLYQYILLYSKSVTLISLFLFNLSITVSPIYLIGPMLYFYVRSVLTDHAKLSKKDIWHFLPMLIYFIAALPNTLVPWHEKVEAAQRAVSDGSYIMNYKATALSSIIPTMYMYVARLVLILSYTLLSLAMFISYQRKNKWDMVFSNQQFMKKWLCCLLGFMLILSVSQILLVVKSFEMHFSDLFFAINVIRILSVMSLMGLLISPFLFPAILYGLPRMPERAKRLNQDGEKTGKQTNESRQTTIQFESDYLESIDRKTNSYMEKHQLYLQSDCNLSQFSKHIGVPAHHLAYYFREVKKQRFNDFRNEWRINHAKSLIREGKANEITLEAIGSLSGFSSRNAFTTYFKKVEGTSPSVYASHFN